MSNEVNKSIKKMMRKLTSFGIKNENLKLDVSLKIKFNSIWISSEEVNDRGYGPLIGVISYHCIINMPTLGDEIKEFEQTIENEMAYLAVESRKLTKKGE